MADTVHSAAHAGAPRRGGGTPSGTGRVLAVDVARSLAIIGMVSVNLGPKTGTGVGNWLYQLPHGRASVLFVLLAGVGFSLMTRRARAREANLGAMWGTLAWRCAVLLLAGLALQLLGHDANVILQTYAVLFLVAGLLVRAGDRALLAVAALSATAGPALWLGPQVVRDVPFPANPPQLGDPPGEVLVSILLTGPYPLVTWLAPFVLGMWLGRRDLTDPSAQRRLVLVSALVALAAPALARAATAMRGGMVGDRSWELLLTDAPHGQMPLWLLGASGAAVLILGGCLLVERWLRGAGRTGFLRPLVATGQLSLTIYVLHLVVIAGLRPLPHSLAQGVVLSVAIVVGAVLFAVLWRSWFRRGPLEMVARAPWTWRAARG